MGFESQDVGIPCIFFCFLQRYRARMNHNEACVEFSTSIWDFVTNQTTKMNKSHWVNLGKVTQLTDVFKRVVG